MMDPARLEIAIIGAGIAGLTAAITLKNHPHVDVEIYEKAKRLEAIGASIALGPNGMRTLDRLGVRNALDDDIAFRNKSRRPMIYRHYKTNEIVSVDEHKGPVEYRHLTSRYHRAHLQEALVQHVDPAQIHLDKAFHSVHFDESINKLVITFTDTTTTQADLLLGADGIHSAVRRFFAPSSTPKWTGWTAFRSVFPLSHLSQIPNLPDEATHIWGPDRTLFISKLGRDLFTVVGSHQADPDAADTPWKDKFWDEEGGVDVLRDYYKDWSPLVRQIIDATPYTRIHPNYAADGLGTWVLDDIRRVTLAGDAAHAHGGAFAAGGSLAIDDAWAFAASVLQVFPSALAGNGPPRSEDIALALRLYEKTRKAHTDRVLETVHEGNRNKVLRSKEARVETDEGLRARMKGRGGTSWIHEHDVVAVFSHVVAEMFGGSGVQDSARL